MSENNQQKSHKRKNLAIGILLLVGIGLVMLNLKTCSKKNLSDGMLAAVYDTLDITRNDLGQEVAKTSLIQGDFDDFKNVNAGKDSTLRKLQEIVDRGTINATVFNNSTSNTITGVTTVTSRDTVWEDSLIYIYPQYSLTFKNRWEDFNILANRDTVLLMYKLFNEFHLESRWERQGLFKPKKAVVIITNINPNTETLELKSFNIPPPKPRKTLWLVAGAIIGGTIVILAR